MELTNKKFRFHIFSLPHTVTHIDYCACAYTMKVLKFCKMMKTRGHYIIHYGHEESVVDCDEHVSLITNEDLEKCYGSYNWREDFFKHNTSDHCHIKFNNLGSEEVLKRIKQKDFVLIFWGPGHHKIAETVKNDKRALVVEPGIGYHASFCQFKIFESYAWLNHHYGNKSANPSWYDAVIPNYFNIENFEFSNQKKDYFLCLGRISTCKGVHIAIQITEKIGAKLVIAGQGDICTNLGYSKIPDHVEYVGYADVNKRKNLMKNAKCVFLLSDYVEPFGGVAVEAMLSGTPVITPDWGVFNETVLHGITGYRCRTFEQMCWAAKNINKINPEACREWAVNNYSLERVSKMYEEYFLQLYHLWEGGWYQENLDRKDFNWLSRYYPTIKNKPKIAIWSEKGWALGQIHDAIIKYMSDDYNFEYFKWDNSKRNYELWGNEGWKNYDIILGNTMINFGLNIQNINNPPLELLKKTIPVFHCPVINHNFYTEKIVYKEGPLFVGITEEIVENIYKEYNIKAELALIGVDIDNFYPTREIKQIKTLGFIGNPNVKNDVKRMEMFDEICEKSNLKKMYIYDKPHTLYKDLYKDIDMLIYCSVFEGISTGTLEAAACGIPVISTNVGSAKYINFKTFETVDEAVDIINNFNNNPDNLKGYIISLTAEVISNWNWEKQCKQYWKPLFEKRLAMNESSTNEIIKDL